MFWIADIDENQFLHKHFEFLLYSFSAEFSIRWRKKCLYIFEFLLQVIYKNHDLLWVEYAIAYVYNN